MDTKKYILLFISVFVSFLSNACFAMEDFGNCELVREKAEKAKESTRSNLENLKTFGFDEIFCCGGDNVFDNFKGQKGNDSCKRTCDNKEFAVVRHGNLEFKNLEVDTILVLKTEKIGNSDGSKQVIEKRQKSVKNYALSENREFVFIEYWFGKLEVIRMSDLTTVVEDVYKWKISKNGEFVFIKYYSHKLELRRTRDLTMVGEVFEHVHKWEISKNGELVLIKYFVSNKLEFRRTSDFTRVGEVLENVHKCKISKNGELVLFKYWDNKSEFRRMSDFTRVGEVLEGVLDYDISENGEFVLIRYSKNKLDLRRMSDFQVVVSCKYEEIYDFKLSYDGQFLLYEDFNCRQILVRIFDWKVLAEAKSGDIFLDGKFFALKVGQDNLGKDAYKIFELCPCKVGLKGGVKTAERFKDVNVIFEDKSFMFDQEPGIAEIPVAKNEFKILEKESKKRLKDLPEKDKLKKVKRDEKCSKGGEIECNREFCVVL